MRKSVIERKIQELPNDLQREVFDYIDFLAKKYKSPDRKGKKEKFRFDWEGCLAGVVKKLSSVELQHKASEWR